MPNFTLNPEELPGVEDGRLTSKCVTLQLQYLEALPDHRDLVFTGISRPRHTNAQLPVILLAFIMMYGVVEYNCWGVGKKMQCLTESS
jgi:hypothetical protein